MAACSKKMRKTLQDVAQYLQNMLPLETNEAYSVKPLFANIARDEKIREGILAFRNFLNHLYDVLISKGAEYDDLKKVAHAYENRISLSVYYPFLQNIKTLLTNIALQGILAAALAEDHQSLICSNTIFDTRISFAKSIQCLQFLHDCGLQIDGIDLQEKRKDFSNVETIIFSYPKNDAMLIGLKVMAIAEEKLGTLENQDIFLRCDYRIIKNEEVLSADEASSIIKHATRFLSSDVQNFILQLHQTHVEKGLKPFVEIKGFWIIIKYTYKRKELWGFNVSLANGIHINIKTQNMDKYADVIEKFPLILREIIEKGYGCGRKRFGVCDGNCRGMVLPLDNSILAIKTDIETWFEHEMKSIL
jgi:hypothetical protein